MEYTSLIGPALFIGCGLLVLLAFLPALRMARATASWPLVSGEIVASKLVTRWVSSSDGRDEVRKTRITYRYDVAGRSFQGNRIIAGPLGVLCARQVVRRYRKGDTCRVAHHPQRPQVAVLEPGTHFVHWLPPAVGLLFCGLGFYMLGSLLQRAN
jgi:Protein of unknown function (DUF3592)